MKSVEEFSIDGLNIQIYTMQTSKALKWFRRLQKALIPSIGKLISAYDSKKKEIAGDMLGEALEGLSEFVSEEQYVEWAKELLAEVRIDGAKVNLETDFHGKLLTLHKILLKVLEVNFSDFLSGVKDAGFVSKLKSQIGSKE